MVHPSANNSPLVVVVDADGAVSASIKFSLEIDGFSVVTLSQAGEVLAAPELLDESCCMIIDYRLSDMNGVELIREIRKRTHTTPAILITSSPAAHLRELATVADVITVEKPLLGNTLQDAIGKALNLS